MLFTHNLDKIVYVSMSKVYGLCVRMWVCVCLTYSYARHLISMKFSTDIISYTKIIKISTALIRCIFTQNDNKIVSHVFMHVSSQSNCCSFISPFCKFICRNILHQNELVWWAAWEILCKFNIWRGSPLPLWCCCWYCLTNGCYSRQFVIFFSRLDGDLLLYFYASMRTILRFIICSISTIKKKHIFGLMLKKLKLNGPTAT